MNEPSRVEPMTGVSFVFILFVKTKVNQITESNIPNTVIPRLTKIIRSGITFVTRNLRYPNPYSLAESEKQRKNLR
jgi:hypothetical protein